MYDYILKGTIIDGVSDEPLNNGIVAIKGEKLAYVGSADDFEIPEGIPVYTAATILPGFMDCHIHLNGGEDAGELGDNAAFGDLLLGSAYQAGILLDAGFTSVRDMSEQGLYLARAQSRGILRGPRVMPGGRCLGVTAGHGDDGPHLTKEEINQKASTCVLCDGVDECTLAARTQFRKGAKFLKIFATGGVSSPTDGVDDVQFSFEEIKAIVDEAKRHHTYVTAHCTGNEGAYQALKAGVECIEHGVMLTQREIDLMAEKNIPLVSTLYVSHLCSTLKGPDWFMEKASKCYAANVRTIDMARKAGIRIALGTDFSNSKGTPYRHEGREFVAMVNAGMTPMEAIKAGTINSAYVMRTSDRLGSLEVGKLADVVMVDGDPLSDINILADADHVTAVFQNGIKVK
ncbi:MAG: amidohydrolase family protein [Oscillospiraceae bacterium]|nr:amidohydrolase family protein [Oscillospiraceae bacterium]